MTELRQVGASAIVLGIYVRLCAAIAWHDGMD